MNKYKATCILIIVTIGYLVSLPFHKTFWGGLISSGFCASMIGGFADWYGITALFRKPLGIKYKTEIVPKNREKIFDGLSDMVSEQLLTKEYIKILLKDYDISKLIIKFSAEKKVEKNLKLFLNLIIEEGLNGIDENEIESLSINVVKNNIERIDINKLLFSAVDISIKNGYDDKLINFFLEEIYIYMESESFKALLITLIDETKVSYEKGMARRAIVNGLVLETIMNLSSEKLADLVKEKIIVYMKQLENPQNEERIKLKGFIALKIDELKDNNDIKEKIEAFKVKQIEALNIHNYITSTFISLKEKGFKEEGISKKLIVEAENQIEALKDEFNENEIMQHKVDLYLKDSLYKLVDNFHHNIGKLVRENLSKYSNEMLVDLIEDKAGNDLQLIRINGSVVGGLVGIAFFLITYAI